MNELRITVLVNSRHLFSNAWDIDWNSIESFKTEIKRRYEKIVRWYKKDLEKTISTVIFLWDKEKIIKNEKIPWDDVLGYIEKALIDDFKGK